jgi:hypothetical protein
VNVNNGRASDAMSNLAPVGSKTLEKPRKEVVSTSLGSTYFTWEHNSCWLDVGLVLLDNVLSWGWEEFKEVCSSLLNIGGLGIIIKSMQRIQSFKLSPRQESSWTEFLNEQCNLVHETLLREKIIRDLQLLDMVFVSLSVLPSPITNKQVHSL